MSEWKWDEFGSTVRDASRMKPGRWVDLRPLTSLVLPATLPAGLHLSWSEPPPGSTEASIRSDPFLCKSTRCRGYAGADKVLNGFPGINYLMYIEDVSDALTGPDAWLIRFGHVRQGPLTERAVVQPMSVADILAGRLRATPETIDAGRFPHRCPRCGSPAYVGMQAVDCLRGCR